MRVQRASLSLLLLSLAVVGCESTKAPATPGSKPKSVKSAGGPDATKTDHSNPFIRFIPKDTPFLFMGLKPLDSAMWQDVFSSFQDAMSAQTMQLSEELENSLKSGSKVERLLGGFILETVSRVKAGGLPSIGLSSNPQYALYGMGLAPVVRIKLSDPHRFKGFIEAAMARSKVSLTPKLLNGQSYWLYGGTRVTGVLSLTQDQIILSALPSSLVDEFLPSILGQEKLGATLGTDDTIPKLLKRRRFAGIAFGFLDIRGIAEKLMTETDSRVRRVLRGFGAQLPKVTAECKADLTRLLAYASRVEFGIESSSAKRIVSLAAISSKPALTSIFERATSYVPGLGTESTGSLSLGLGLNMGKLIAEVTPFLKGAQPLKCRQLGAFNHFLTRMKLMAETKLPMLPPVVHGINGLYLEVSNLNFIMKGSEQFSGFLILSAAKVQALFGLAQVMFPPLNQVKFEPTGALHDVQVKEGILAPNMRPKGLMVSDGMGIALGKTQAERLETLLKQGSKEPSAFMSYGYHMGRLFGALDTLRARLQRAQGKAEAAQQKSVADKLGRLRVDMSARHGEFIMRSSYENN